MYHKDEERKPFSMAMAAHKSPIQSMSSNWSAMDVLCIVIHHITHNLYMLTVSELTPAYGHGNVGVVPYEEVGTGHDFH